MPSPPAFVEAISVGKLVRRRLGHAADPWELALVQRNVVWDEVRMARLLDSLLAGYPIGALLVCRVRAGGSIVVQTDHGREARPAEKTVSQLLDGQQRVNALVCLFSEAGGFGCFFLDMTAPRMADEVVTRRRDKRTTIRYIRWSADGRFDDAPGEGERERFLDLSRLSEWAARVGEDGVLAALRAVEADPAAAIVVLNDIDADFADELAPAPLAIAANRTRRLLDIWLAERIPVQHLVLDEPADVLQVFTRINLEGVRVAGEDVFFAGVKTQWPAAEQVMHRLVTDMPIVGRMTALRVLSRLASVQAGQGDMLPLRVDSLNGDKGRKIIEALEDLTGSRPELPRMKGLSDALIGNSGLGHSLRLIDSDLYDHVLAWVGVNDAAIDPKRRQDWMPAVASYLIGATAYRWPTVLRDTFSRMAFREAVAAGVAGEAFPVERIVAAARRQWPELRVGQRAVQSGPVEVNSNAHLFLSVVQRLPFDLPPGREVEWDHIYAQALSSRMKWRGKSGTERLQYHPQRSYVWHGANLWALDGVLNLAASDLKPSAKFEFLESLGSQTGTRYPNLWPDEGFLTNEERALVLQAEKLIWEELLDAGMAAFERFVVGRAERIRGEILALFPSIAMFAADAEVDAYAFEDRQIPAELIRAPLARVPTTSPVEAATPEGLLSPDEIRAIAYEFLRTRDPDRTNGEHYYDVLHAVEVEGRVAAGDPAPRVYGVLSNAPLLFASLGTGRFTWVPRNLTGNRYWVMRSDRGNRPVLWAELTEGRLRQGWGWADDQDLREMRCVALSNGSWSETQRAARRNRRMLNSEDNGIQIGDLIVVPHMPAENRISIVRVVGTYEYGSRDGWNDYRHILPVELLTSSSGIGLNDKRISPRLRASIGNQNRMWNIDPVGPDVEALTQAVYVSD